MDIEIILSRLYSLQKFGIKLGLQNITGLLERLDNPHKRLKMLHIAGSNGKGSVCSFLASILMESGYKTGLYTSPHLVRFNERIRINGKEIEDEYIADFYQRIEPLIEEMKPTFFEVTTALAFKYFADNNVDYAVIETGLGGRLDSTNVINPLASVITSISLEHTEYLGTTLREIALEKAGIIKQGMPVFIGGLPQEAETAIAEKASQRGSELFRINDYLKENSAHLPLEFEKKSIILPLESPLKGTYQIKNAALASLTAYKTLNINDSKIIERALKNVLKNTGFQGRYETYNPDPLVIFDAAHNVEGIENFIEVFSKERKNPADCVLIFGVMRDKAYKEMLRMLKPYFSEFRFVTIGYERSSSYQELSSAASETGIAGIEEKDPARYIKDFIKAGGRGTLVVAGSIYVLGEIKKQLLKLDILHY